MIGVTLLIISVLVILVWLLLEFKRLKHRIFALFIIFLILFVYFTGLFVFKDTTIDYKSVPGLVSASKVYFSWVLSISGNFKTITSNAVGLDWKGNVTTK